MPWHTGSLCPGVSVQPQGSHWSLLCRAEPQSLQRIHPKILTLQNSSRWSETQNERGKMASDYWRYYWRGEPGGVLKSKKHRQGLELLRWLDCSQDTARLCCIVQGVALDTSPAWPHLQPHNIPRLTASLGLLLPNTKVSMTSQTVLTESWVGIPSELLESCQ